MDSARSNPSPDGEEGVFRLDPSEVERVYAICRTNGPGIAVDAITGLTHFHAHQIAQHAEIIGAWLLELPTGMQSTVARLFNLGMAAGLVQCQLPREIWPALPGGVPYYVVLDQTPDLSAYVDAPLSASSPGEADRG